MIHKISVLLIICAVISSSCTPKTTTQTDTPKIELADCVLSTSGAENEVDAKCGSLQVLENPSDPQSRKISLNIAVVPAINRTPEPDPLFVLAGGPGQTIVEIFPSLHPALFAIHKQRDIVLFDQGRTGKSTPFKYLNFEDESLQEEAAIQLVKNCPKKLNADLQFYTTDIALYSIFSL